MTRQHIPDSTQNALFWKSQRRCALCFGLENDFSEKRGQIAHLNKDNTQTRLEDLVWLCIPHHDQYDSTTRQSKNYTVSEVRNCRERLYAEVERVRAESEAKQEDKAATTNALSALFSYMPYTHLGRYIYDFPEVFSQNILDPLWVWDTFRRSNPHIYPFADKILNSRLESFFSANAKLNRFIRSEAGGVPYFKSIVDYNGVNHKLAFNKDLGVDSFDSVYKEAMSIQRLYTNNYEALTNYIRREYPQVSFTGY